MKVMRFADFELDVEAYSLRRSGIPVKLERKAMEVLLLLVRRPGVLISRADIQSALWAGVNVNYDLAINTVARKVRQALGDDADNPVFVETVVGKGYRFIAAVHHTAAGSSESKTEDSDDHALPPAFLAYVRGRHAWNKRTEADLREALRQFQQAIDLDPTYAPAYAGLADAYAQLGYGSFVSPEDSFPRAKAAASRALALDPSLPEAHAAMGYSLMYYDWDFAAAERSFLRAIALNPNAALPRQWYAYLLTALDRRVTEAEREILTAKRLDPLSVATYIDHAYILHYYGRNDEAVRSVRLALEMNPRFPLAHFWLARIFTAQGRFDEAEDALRNIGPLHTWTPAMAVVGYLYGRMGRRAAAHRVLAAFDEVARSGRYASSYAIAVVHAGLGDRERVLSTLESALQERSHWLVWLKRDPRWDEVRDAPRFQQLVQMVNLTA